MEAFFIHTAALILVAVVYGLLVLLRNWMRRR